MNQKIKFDVIICGKEALIEDRINVGEVKNFLSMFKAQDLGTCLSVLRYRRVDLAMICQESFSNNEAMQLFKEIKKALPLIPVIFLVSEPHFKNIEVYYKLGADLVIREPVNPEILFKSVLRLVDPQRSGKFRIHDRYEVKLKMSWREEDSEHFKKGKTLNLASGGMFVSECDFLPNRRSLVNFNIEFFKDDIKVISGKAIVRWTRTIAAGPELAGFGAEFLYVNVPEFHQALSQFPPAK